MQRCRMAIISPLPRHLSKLALRGRGVGGGEGLLRPRPLTNLHPRILRGA